MAASNSPAEQLITENIDIWTSAIKKRGSQGRGSNKKFELHGIKKLRELILEFAVRGLLVPQNPSDEPAANLLSNIFFEKEQLFKDGRLKKQKPLSEISEEEKPFNLPSGWEWARLSSVGNIFNGNSVNAKIKEEKYTGINGLPYIATKDVGYGFEALDYYNGIFIPAGEPKFKIARVGAILICSEGGSAGKKCGIVEEDVCFGNKLFANEVFGDIEPEMILTIYQSPSFFQAFTESMTGIIGGISSAKFSELIIPLPPVKEQSRIVAKVNELMALCNQLEQQTETSLTTHQTLVETLLNVLLSTAQTAGSNEGSFDQAWYRIERNFDVLFTTNQSIAYLLTTIVELASNGWLIKFDETTELLSISDLLTFGPRNGFSPKSVDYETQVKVLKLGATTKGYLDLDESKFINVEIEKNSHLWIKSGDILLQRGNSAEYVGCNLLVTDEIGSYIYPDLMMKLRVNEKVIPEYLSLVLSSPGCRQQMWDKMTGTSGTMPKISKKVVESVTIQVPSLKIQLQIIKKTKQIEEMCRLMRISVDNAQLTKIQLTETIVKGAVA